MTEARTAIARARALSEERFVAGSGPGGQNANKVATSVQLRVPLAALDLPTSVYHRAKRLAGGRMTLAGEIVIEASEHRTQAANRESARERLEALIEAAFRRPARRRKTRLNRLNKVKRLKGKKARGQVKTLRGPVRRDD